MTELATNSASSSSSEERLRSKLAEGHAIVRARGMSMVPAVLPGDEVEVRPLACGEVPDVGSCVIFLQGDNLVLHRLVAVRDQGSGVVCTSQGDSVFSHTESFGLADVLAVAVAVRRRKLFPAVSLGLLPNSAWVGWLLRAPDLSRRVNWLMTLPLRLVANVKSLALSVSHKLS